MNWDYLAGFFDGEGNISIKHKRDRKPWVAISISQKKHEVLYQINVFLAQQGIDSHIYPIQHNRGKVLQISDRASVLKFLKRIATRVTVKKGEVIEALKLDYDRKWTHLKADDINKLLHLRAQGLSLRGIVRKSGRSYASVLKFCKGVARGRQQPFEDSKCL